MIFRDHNLNTKVKVTLKAKIIDFFFLKICVCEKLALKKVVSCFPHFYFEFSPSDDKSDYSDELILMTP